MKTKYEGVIRYIAKCMSERNYKEARHHIKRIWNRPDLTDTEEYVLREQALKAFSRV
jgi:hypothetical protein